MLSDSPLQQINTVLPKYQRLHGAFSMGTSESLEYPPCSYERVTVARSKANDLPSRSRLTSAKTHTHRSNLKAAVLSCKAARRVWISPAFYCRSSFFHSTLSIPHTCQLASTAFTHASFHLPAAEHSDTWPRDRNDSLVPRQTPRLFVVIGLLHRGVAPQRASPTYLYRPSQKTPPR